MRINASKTTVMPALIPGEQRQAVLLVGELLEDVEKFKYLGSMFIANGQGTEEIRRRINLARSALSRLQSYLWSRCEIYKGQDLPGNGAIDSALWLRNIARPSGRRKDAGGL